MQKKSINILENSDDELVDILYELDDDFNELIEMVEDIEDERILSNQLEYEATQGDNI